MIREIRQIKEVVRGILEEYPECRENDNLLMLKVWAYQHPHLRQPLYLFSDFAVDFIRGVYASAESIRRTRQKLQEVNPELRGKNYKGRHEEAEGMQKEMRNKS